MRVHLFVPAQVGPFAIWCGRADPGCVCACTGRTGSTQSGSTAAAAAASGAGAFGWARQSWNQTIAIIKIISSRLLANGDTSSLLVMGDAVHQLVCYSVLVERGFGAAPP